MPTRRFTIAGLMAAIALLGVEFAALRAASPFWFSAVYTLTVALLLVATLLARFRRLSARAFWFGFALFGWTYLLLVLGPWSSALATNHGSSPQTNPTLLTTYVFWSTLHAMRGSARTYQLIDEFTASTMGLAHLMVTLALALIGGWAAVFVNGRRRQAKARSSTRMISLIALGGVALLAYFGARSLRREPSPAYFPAQAFGDESEGEEPKAGRYSKHLRAAGEPSLWQASQAGGDSGYLAYRILWLPAFQHPVCLRVTQSNESVTLRAVVLDGFGGYEPGQLAIDKTIRVDDADWADLSHELIRLKFWTLPTAELQPASEYGLASGVGPIDADEYILEGASAGHYHVVDRSELDEDFLEIWSSMARLSGLGLR